MTSATQQVPLRIYPTNKMIGVIDDLEEAGRAVEDLQKAGVPEQAIEVFCGLDAVRQIDFRGKRHGWFGKLVRTVQKIGDEYDNAVHHEKEVLAGHALIAVEASDESSRPKILDILKAHGAHFVHFYGDSVIETLVD